MRWLPFVLALIAAAFDVFKRKEIPDLIPILILLWGVGNAALGMQAHSVLSDIAGCGLGLAVSLALFALGGLGGGDVKLIASLGAVFGLPNELSLLFYVGISGAILALIAKSRGQREFAYAPAIAIGTFIVIFQGAK